MRAKDLAVSPWLVLDLDRLTEKLTHSYPKQLREAHRNKYSL